LRFCDLAAVTFDIVPAAMIWTQRLGMTRGCGATIINRQFTLETNESTSDACRTLHHDAFVSRLNFDLAEIILAEGGNVSFT
jgi:hypothetical protein